MPASDAAGRFSGLAGGATGAPFPVGLTSCGTRHAGGHLRDGTVGQRAGRRRLVRLGEKAGLDELDRRSSVIGEARDHRRRLALERAARAAEVRPRCERSHGRCVVLEALGVPAAAPHEPP